jgi:hypothetical protein
MTLQGIYQQLPRGIKPVLKRVYFFIKWFVNGARLPFLQFKNHVNVHLGCGDEKKKEFINIDIRTTVATDYTVDLNRLRWFTPGSVRCFYSHAFFEHLYRTERIVHMKSVHRSLMDDGFCCYIGLPYFPNIARYYLDRRTPGIVGERFDLFNVYRYTHGDPEHAPTWWLAQLHKSLFDEDELSQLLRESGLVSHTIFVYCCIGEEGWYVSAGFFAKKGSHDLKTLQEDATRFLTDYAHNKVLLHTITFV